MNSLQTFWPKQTRWLLCSGALIVAQLTSTGAAAADTGPPVLTRLSAGEVSELFSRNLIIRDGLPGAVGWSDEFTTKGMYGQSGPNIPRRGSYVVRGDTVCVSIDGRTAEDCKAFYRSPNGDLWVVPHRVV